MPRSLLLALALYAPAAHAVPDECERWSGPGGPPPVVQDGTCIASPPIGTFNPVVEWEWTGISSHPNFTKVMMTPAVANVTDDNGDGKVGTKDIPDIAFTSYPSTWGGSGFNYRAPGVLFLVSGDGSKTHWALEKPGGYSVFGSGGVAIGDVNVDGKPDICFAAVEVAVACVDNKGALVMAGGNADENHYYGYPAIADMNHDGKPEVIFGRNVFDNKGNWVGQGDWGDGRVYMSVPVDWDADGDLEIIGGNAVYEMDGTVTQWLTPGGGTPTTMYQEDGIPAIGDFDGDGFPDVIKTISGSIVAIDNFGYELWRAPIPGGGTGGAPTVADFDGDGEPEVGVAGYDAYGVYDTDGELLWQKPVHDHSSNVTGSSVYDFEGDGIAEVVYADEYTLWVFRGYDGKVLMENTDHASATLYEYPVIADVDGDDHTEIVVISNNYGNKGPTGITVIGDADDSWFPARPVWNQFAYHITNVNNDGSIPKFQQENWLTWNNFRAGGTELGPSHWLAQLTGDEPDLCLTDCADPGVEVYVPVINEGLLDAAGFEIGFYRRVGGVETRFASYTASYLAGGTSAVFGPYLVEEADWAGAEVVVVIDDLDTSRECDESDNRIELGPWPYPESDLDVDGDGFRSEECGGDDCDDADPLTNPDGTDIPGDGKDQNCTGTDTPIDFDCDADDDGVENEECNGDDCDDTDPDIFPGAEDVPEDGIDQDCDGADALDPGTGELDQTCGCGGGDKAGCDTAGGALASWALLLGLAGIARRRR